MIFRFPSSSFSSSLSSSSVFFVFLAMIVLVGEILCAGGKDYYKVLGVDRQADDRTLKKAYRREAMKHHPDKGGSEEKFAEIGQAYEVLTDKEKRQIYDQYGEEGLKQREGGGGGGGGGGNPFGGGHPFGGFGGRGGNTFTFEFGGGGGGGGFDPFGDMFGGGGGGRRQQQQRREQPPREKEDLYDPKKGHKTKNLKRSKFPDSNAKNVWLIEFYAPWCQHCKRFVKDMEKLNEDLDGFARVGAVNCEKEKALCLQEGVSEYPKVKLRVAGVNKQYDGESVNYAKVKEWAFENLPSKAESIRKPEMFTKFREKHCPEGQGMKSVCVLYFNNKQTTPNWLKIASYNVGKVHKEVKFADVRVPNNQIALMFDVDKIPSLVVFCDGDFKRSVVGEKKEWMDDAAKPSDWSEPWLMEHANREYCDRKMRTRDIVGTTIDPSMDFSKMRVAKLKAMLAANNVSCQLCVEKGDFVKALKEFAASGGAKRDEL